MWVKWNIHSAVRLTSIILRVESQVRCLNHNITPKVYRFNIVWQFKKTGSTS
jgi:hypothetical protein